MRFVAFLRAVNVGGRVVKMDALRKAFESLGLANVETFIASGNVLFDARSGSRALEKKIEAHLQTTLGYRVDTFIRSEPEIAAMARYEPFKGRVIDGAAVYVALLGSPPGADVQRKIAAFQTADETFHIRGRELYWQCRPSMRVATFSGALLEKTLGGPATMRNSNTIRRLAAKLAAGSDA